MPEDNGYSAWKARLAPGHTIPHYYGDYVRWCFVSTAALSLVAMATWGPILPYNVVLQVAAAVLLILLAGFTSAKSLLSMIANGTVAAVSIILIETFAVELRIVNSAALFFAREAAVLLMIAALYFSVRTARNMMMGKVGHPDSPLEFIEEP